MSQCNDCKHNREDSWCKFFSATLKSMNQPVKNCIGYKKKVEPSTNDIKKKSIKQEKRLAKDIGARRTPMSGAIDTSPSDMIKGNYIIESKATKGKSISVKEEWLSSLKRSPMHLGKIPTLILEFEGRRRYVIMAEEDFNNLGDNNEK